MKKASLAISAVLLTFALPGPAFAGEVLRMAVSLTMPPYVFSETDSGIDLEIVREVLAIEGYEVEPVYVVFGRTARDLRMGKVDGALTVRVERGLGEVCLTDEYIRYQNVAVSLKKKGYDIDSPADLADKRITCFQDGIKVLGEEFAEAAEKSPHYYEIPDQENQVALLFKGRTDVIVLDKTIFEYYRKHTDKADTSAPVEVHEIFEPTRFSAGFRKPEHCRAFNKGLEKLKESSRYQAIYNKYLE